MTTDSSTAASTEAKATLLFVDDEPNILSSLQRLFRPLGYRILTAPGGAEGLVLLESEKVDLIISDMRMPGMDGAAFLEQAAKQWPQVVRILLTGYADLSSAVTAVNKGNIYRYLSKPWEDNDIKITVQLALEKQRLEARVVEQNAQLKDLNASLEAKVAVQTQEIRQVFDQLKVAYEELKKSFVTSVRVFSNLIELREGELSGHSRRAAEHAFILARRLGLNQLDAQQVLYAALLHDIGKIGLPDVLLGKPYESLTDEERVQVMRHPATGQAALLAVEPMQQAALFIRHHHERYDGRGFPDALCGNAIPFGARVLAVTNDYDALQRGTLVAGKQSPVEARAFLERNREQRYDPKVVDAFVALLAEADTTVAAPVTKETRLRSAKLKPGMVLTRDLINDNGMLLLPQGRELSMDLIEKIRIFERENGAGSTIYVQAH
jgi:response regulator RpfG family c-di-GMP phosphodiesterase